MGSDFATTNFDGNSVIEPDSDSDNFDSTDSVDHKLKAEVTTVSGKSHIEEAKEN